MSSCACWPCQQWSVAYLIILLHAELTLHNGGCRPPEVDIPHDDLESHNCNLWRKCHERGITWPMTLISQFWGCFRFFAAQPLLAHLQCDFEASLKLHRPTVVIELDWLVVFGSPQTDMARFFIIKPYLTLLSLEWSGPHGTCLWQTFIFLKPTTFLYCCLPLQVGVAYGQTEPRKYRPSCVNLHTPSRSAPNHWHPLWSVDHVKEGLGLHRFYLCLSALSFTDHKMNQFVGVSFKLYMYDPLCYGEFRRRKISIFQMHTMTLYAIESSEEEK